MLGFRLIEFSENFNTFNLMRRGEKRESVGDFFIGLIPQISQQQQKNNNNLKPYHLRGEVEIKGLVTRPKASSQNSNSQVDPRIYIWIATEVLLKIRLIFLRQSQISNL